MAVKTLGDPHLGKAFLNGVPLHRRGEREAMQWEDLTRSLSEVEPGDVHVCMGDLFDKFTVPLNVIFRAAQTYIECADHNPHVQYVALRGNHDAARDADKVSAFDIFRAIVGHQSNILVVAEEPVWAQGFIFIPWHPFKDASEMAVAASFLTDKPVEAVFGHWDLNSFGQVNPNLLPIDILKSMTKKIYTGHEHNARTVQAGEVEVVVTGSMQPYSHAEDPEGQLYVTLSLQEALATDVRNKCVRLDLQPNEEIPSLDCLQLTVRKVGEDISENVTVDLGDLNMETLFAEMFATEMVPEEIGAACLERYRNAQLQGATS